MPRRRRRKKGIVSPLLIVPVVLSATSCYLVYSVLKSDDGALAQNNVVMITTTSEYTATPAYTLTAVPPELTPEATVVLQDSHGEGFPAIPAELFSGIPSNPGGGALDGSLLPTSTQMPRMGSEDQQPREEPNNPQPDLGNCAITYPFQGTLGVDFSRTSGPHTYGAAINGVSQNAEDYGTAANVDPVIAVISGKVLYSSHAQLLIDGPCYWAYYYHVDQDLRYGQQVEIGQAIGREACNVDSTSAGCSGPHVHLNIYVKAQGRSVPLSALNVTSWPKGNSYNPFQEISVASAIDFLVAKETLQGYEATPHAFVSKQLASGIYVPSSKKKNVLDEIVWDQPIL